MAMSSAERQAAYVARLKAGIAATLPAREDHCKAVLLPGVTSAASGAEQIAPHHNPLVVLVPYVAPAVVQTTIHRRDPARATDEGDRIIRPTTTGSAARAR
jgi:hypothetical protein